MMRRRLTREGGSATSALMARSVLIPILGGVAASGCIQVSAPEKPIEINLNVNVRQEVVVRLQRDAEEFIENNPELFPE